MVNLLAKTPGDVLHKLLFQFKLLNNFWQMVQTGLNLE